MIKQRQAQKAEMSEILNWAAQEGWNPGLGDADAFYAADSSGFFVATDNDRPVAAISVVNHTERFAFLGLYIVLPEYRGRGIGYDLWQHALEHAGDRTVGLDGVPDQQSNYTASGFVHAGATTRFAGVVPAKTDPAVRMATAEEINSLIEREQQDSGVRKQAYLSTWFSHTDTRRTLIADDKAGNQIGFCTVRKCRQGAKIGPLCAATRTQAARLIEHAATVFDSDIVIDVPDASNALSDLCRDYGLLPGFETARMYRGPFQATRPSLYAVASLELG